MNGAMCSAAAERAVGDWIVPEWPAPARVQALVTTRNGGVSAPPYASLNLGFSTAHRASGDDPAAIAENRRRVGAQLPSPPLWLDQVHGAGVAVLDGRAPGAPPVADAAVTRAPNVVLAILMADCLPLLLADRAGTVIGIAHGGWRGLAAGVIENTLATMAVSAGDVVAWLGPAIGPAAFEVGADVYDAFVARDAGAATAFRVKGSGKWWADIPALARRRLERAGVRAIHGGEFCTYGDPARFFSYRRDGETGRMAALLWLRSPRSR